MKLLAWHYSEGIGYYLQWWQSFVVSSLRFFSLPVLAKTLFSPWKRMTSGRSSSGFNFQKMFDEFSFDVTSRTVGFFVRISLIFVALLMLIASVFVGLGGFVLWILIPILSFPSYQKYLKRADLFAQKLVPEVLASSNPIKTLFDNEAGNFTLAHVGLEMSKLIEKSTKHVGLKQSHPYTGYAEVLAHVVESGVWQSEFWREVDVSANDLLLAAKIWDGRQELLSKISDSKSVNAVKGIGVQLLFGYTPTLDKVGSELRLQPGRPTLLRGRNDVLTRLERILAAKSSVLLTGQPGVGKKAILLELADRLDSNYQRLIDVNIVNLTAGVFDRNEKKIVIQSMLAEAASAGNVVLVIRDLARLTNAQMEGNDFTDIFESQLERKKLSIVAVVTPEENEKYISRNSRLMKYFEKLEVVPLPSAHATQVLIDKAAELENATGITIPIPVLRKMVTLADRYFSDIPFPKKAVELLENCVNYVQHQNKKAITIDDITTVISERTGIPLTTLTSEDKKKLANVETLMHEQIVGQKTAISMIGQSLRSRVMGVAGSNQPVGTFLFLGPTGVGKTETAKVLSNIYYGHTDIMRFDMAEFVGYEGVTKLIGSAHLNQPGMLTTAVRNNPAGLLLLDELEKATSDIYNVLLTLFDEGYIMDAFGRKIDCRNLFVVATSNAGSDLIWQLVTQGVPGETLQQKVLEHILKERVFSPEFINRFDGVVVYEPLTHEHLTQIAELQLHHFKKRMLEKNVRVEFHDGLFTKVAQDGFDPLFGARPMRRVVDLVIGDIISQALLSEEINPGDKIKILPGEQKLQYHWEKVT